MQQYTARGEPRSAWADITDEEELRDPRLLVPKPLRNEVDLKRVFLGFHIGVPF